MKSFIVFLILSLSLFFSTLPRAINARGTAPVQITRSQWLNGYYLYSWNSVENSVAYCLEVAGNTDIWSLPLSGGSERRLTVDPAQEILPSWSPEGEKLAYLSDRGGTWALWVMNHDDRRTKRLLAVDRLTPLMTEPVWSPDGTSILTISFKGGDWDLWRVGCDGNNALQVTHDDRRELAFSWIDGGKRILYAATDEGESHICMVNGDGTGEERLTREKRVYLLPNPAPDSSALAFVEGGAMDSAIYTMDFQGKEKQRLTAANCLTTLPRWSPDSSSIAYLSGKEMDLHVWKMKKRGEEQQKLTDSGGSFFGLKWLKQNLLSFVSYHDNLFELLTLALDMRYLTSLVETVLVSGRPCWSPGGEQVYYSLTEGKCRRLKVRKVDETDETELFPSIEGAMEYPSIDPSGTRLAFSLAGEKASSIWTGSINGRKALQFSRGTGKEILPSWSPDGTRLAFYRFMEDKWHLVVMDVESKNMLASTPVMEIDDQFSPPPCFSPSGRKLLAMNRGKDGFTLKCLDTVSGELTLLLHARLPLLNPVYSDDEEWVYYFLRDERREELWRMRLKDRKAERLANSKTGETLPLCCIKNNIVIFTRNGSIWLIDMVKQSRRELTALGGEELFPTLSRDGSKLLFISSRGHNRDLFTLDIKSVINELR